MVGKPMVGTEAKIFFELTKQGITWVDDNHYIQKENDGFSVRRSPNGQIMTEMTYKKITSLHLSSGQLFFAGRTRRNWKLLNNAGKSVLDKGFRSIGLGFDEKSIHLVTQDGERLTFDPTNGKIATGIVAELQQMEGFEKYRGQLSR